MSGHIPVLINEVLTALAPQVGETFVDGTFGGGGYSTAILNHANCNVIGADRDMDAITRGAELRKSQPNLTLLQSRFSELGTRLDPSLRGKIHGFVFDLGVSSFQIDTAGRGFSFRFDGPLDMRMGQDGITAADLVNSSTAEHLAYIFKTYGDEKYARKIAAAIVMDRDQEPFTRTIQLAELIRRLVPKSKDGLDPATRTFQALRIAVNQELEEIHAALNVAEQFLAPGGRLVVVSFHALEDRIVKQFLVERAGELPNPSRFGLPGPARSTPSFTLMQKKTIKPTDEEIKLNPRASSARLRGAIRTAAAPFPLTESRYHG